MSAEAVSGDKRIHFGFAYPTSVFGLAYVAIELWNNDSEHKKKNGKNNVVAHIPIRQIFGEEHSYDPLVSPALQPEFEGIIVADPARVFRIFGNEKNAKLYGVPLITKNPFFTLCETSEDNGRPVRCLCPPKGSTGFEYAKSRFPPGALMSFDRPSRELIVLEQAIEGTDRPVRWHESTNPRYAAVTTEYALARAVMHASSNRIEKTHEDLNQQLLFTVVFSKENKRDDAKAKEHADIFLNQLKAAWRDLATASPTFRECLHAFYNRHVDFGWNQKGPLAEHFADQLADDYMAEMLDYFKKICWNPNEVSIEELATACREAADLHFPRPAMSNDNAKFLDWLGEHLYFGDDKKRDELGAMLKIESPGPRGEIPGTQTSSPRGTSEPSEH